MMQKPPPPDLRYATSVGILREHLVKKSNALRFFPFMLAGEIDACPLSGTGVSYGLFSLCTWFCFRLNERLFLRGIFAISDEIDVCEVACCIVGIGLFCSMKNRNVD